MDDASVTPADQEVPQAPSRGAWLRALGVGVFVLALSGVLASISSYTIQARYPDRPRPPDLMFDLLPHLPWTQYVVEALYIGAIVLLAVYALRKEHIRQIPEIVGLFGLKQSFRALIMVLTPLAVPYDEATHYNLTGGRIRNWGEFPSGHAATMLLFYLIVDKDEAPGIKRALLVLNVVQVVFLLTSHSHYSIDIVGGLLLGYFVYHEYFRGRMFNWLKPLLRV